MIGVIQCPLLEDPNTGTIMVESRDIVNHLLSTYGPDAALKKKNHWISNKMKEKAKTKWVATTKTL